LGVVWEDVRAGGWNWNVRFARGVWNPVSQRFDWSPSAGVNTAGGSTDAGSYMHPMIAAGPAGRVYVAWTDWREGIFNQVYFRASSDFGATWGTESRVSDEIGYQPVAGDPSLIVDPYDPVPPQDLYCVFNDWRGNVPGGRYPNVFFSRSTDGGATWGVNVEVNDITDWYQQASARVLVATPNRTLACGWFCDDFSGPTEMRVSLSTDSGATWQASAAVSTPAGCDVVVNLAPGLQNDLLASWAASYNIFFRGSTDAGLTWSDAIPADDAGPGYSSGNPSLAALPSGDPRIVMMDSRPSGAWEVWIAPGVRESAGVEDVAADLAGFALRASPNPLRSRTELAGLSLIH
ncbi:MAG: sialidase family protein, partial [Candidatus Eisenbacteria bacterium]|nr:sialidase family protein [Candidatus Eisenbacteria bacterium]